MNRVDPGAITCSRRSGSSNAPAMLFVRVGSQDINCCLASFKTREKTNAKTCMANGIDISASLRLPGLNSPSIHHVKCHTKK